MKRVVLSLALLFSLVLSGCSAMSTSAIQALQSESYKQGYDQGKEDGYKKGKEEGYKEGLAEGQQISLESPPPDTPPDPPMPLEDYVKTYVLNNHTGKFHLPDCKSVDEMLEHNKKVRETTRDQLIAEGYSPCGNCNP